LTKESPKKERKPYVPSKWLNALIDKNYVSFAERLERQETKRRIKALTNMKNEWRRRVNLL
jgi:hypothetical protein